MLTPSSSSSSSSAYESVSPPLAQSLVLNRQTPIYLVGIGGAGMSSLAQLLLAVGCKVLGADGQDTPKLRLLESAGATVFVGHEASQLPVDAILVYSSAVSSNNPERQVAQARSQRQWHRSDLLKALLEGPLPGFRTTIGLSGTHGKTTLTGMMSMALEAAGLEPTAIAGGKLPGQPGNVRIGQPFNIAVAELDESDGTILAYTPSITLLANLELDHADHYQSGLAGLEATFITYCQQLVAAQRQDSQPRVVIANADCPLSLKILTPFIDELKVIWLGFGPCPSGVPSERFYRIQPQGPDATGCQPGDLCHQASVITSVKAGVPGRHNLFNACLTVLGAMEAGVAAPVAAGALAQFTGMGRRFERVGTLNGAMLVDDYAHHPTEVLETCKAAKAVLGQSKGQLWGIFQPHRFTRLSALWDEFVASFDEVDQVILLDVYPAGEPNIPGVTSTALAQAVANRRGERASTVRYCASFDQARQLLSECVQAHDLVMDMGAGDITHLLRQHPARQSLPTIGAGPIP
jgi:UDP-N-acetylmuramate--alanine ligase